jgi:hypothetical protein
MTLTIPAPATNTASKRRLSIVEDGDILITGHWTPTIDGTVSPAGTVTVVVDPSVSVDVTVQGRPGESWELADPLEWDGATTYPARTVVEADDVLYVSRSTTTGDDPALGGPWQAVPSNADVVARAGLARLRFDVTDYGAKGDGTTDDTAAIQAAIDACAARGGGVVLIPATGAAYRISTVALKTKVQLVGHGRETRLRALADMAAGSAMITWGALDVQHAVIENLHVDGNASEQSNLVHGIDLDNNAGSSAVMGGNRLTRLNIRNTSGDGLRLSQFNRGMIIGEVIFHNCGRDGFAPTSWADSIVHNLDIGNSGRHGLNAQGLFSVGITQVKSWFSDGDNFRLRNTRNCTLLGFQSQDGKQNGMHWSSSTPGDHTGNRVEILSNGDNETNGGHSGLVLDGVSDSEIDARVYERGGRIPEHALAISQTFGCRISLLHGPMRSAGVKGSLHGNTFTVRSRGSVVDSLAPRTALWLPAAVTDYVSTPAHADLEITGDIDIEVEVAAADWLPGGIRPFLSKVGTGSTNRSWRMGLDSPTSGNTRLLFEWTSDGTTWVTGRRNVGAALAANARHRVRVQREAATGLVHFYLNGAYLGTGTSTATGAMHNASAAPLVISQTGVAGATAVEGRYVEAIVRNGIDGPVVAHWRGDVPSSPKFRDVTGKIWTLTGDDAVLTVA